MLEIVRRIHRWMKPMQAFFSGVAVMAVIGIPMALYAQAAAATADSSGGFKGQLITILVGTALAGAVVLSRMILKLIQQGADALKKYIEGKVENEFLESALLRLTGLAHTVAASAWQTGYKATRTELKLAIADGKVSKEELAKAGKAARDGAIKTLREITPTRILKTVLGTDNPSASAEEALLGVMIEGAVHSMKTEGAAVKAAANIVKEGTVTPKV